MALGSKPEDAGVDLRFTRRYVIYAALTLPLLLALYSFASLQAKAPEWPLALTEEPRRGAIVAADGTIFAEGSVEHRRYPQGTLAAHLIGFSGAEQPDGRYGLEGLEFALEPRLQTGEEVRITIDPALQAVTQAELRHAAELHQAENGAAVMLEVGTGRVLAAASYPEFDPNSQSLVGDRSVIANRAFLQQIEPGSTLKPIIVAALMEAGHLRPDEIVEAEMSIRVGNNTFFDVAEHDELLSVAEVLRYSSNVGMIKLGKRFEPKEMYAWLSAFGFGHDVGLRYSYTRPGRLNDWRRWVPQDHASVAIGHSMSTTALQLAVAYSVLANGGLLVPPRIVEDDGWDDPVRVTSPEVARSVLSMLVYTVEHGLRQARVPGMLVAGKTGTADIYDVEQGRYIKSGTLGFAGVFPADDPRAVVVVYLQRPKNTSSTLVATPMFRAIGSEAAALWGLPPRQGYYAEGR